jgi:NAD(P)-dependent dehydrogenase (short-subunit alcohol dehydrogenase family)/acyl carrier protein
VQIAYRAQRRWLRRYERCALPPLGPDARLLKSRGVVLVTGGLGGMGLALALELARRSQARLLLTGRGGLPPRSDWDAHLVAHGADQRDVIAITAIRAIEVAGGEVLVVAADASDRQAMAAAIEVAQAQWGPIDAVIHAAGIAGAGRLSFTKSADEVAAVFAPKAGGLDVLVDLLGSQELEFVALMSSINTVIPAAGLADYAAANAVFDAFVDAAQCAPGWRRVVALDWGAWRDVGMAARLEVPAARRAAWQEYLQTAIGTGDGIDGFCRALASGRRRLVVLPFDLNQVLILARREVAAAAPVVHAAPVAAAGAPAHLLREEFEQGLAEIWVELLGVDSVNAADDFFELGGHSLLATRVLTRIEHRFGVHLALRDIFAAPTLGRLADRIAGHAVGQPKTSTAEDREEIEF